MTMFLQRILEEMKQVDQPTKPAAYDPERGEFHSTGEVLPEDLRRLYAVTCRYSGKIEAAQKTHIEGLVRAGKYKLSQLAEKPDGFDAIVADSKFVDQMFWGEVINAFPAMSNAEGAPAIGPNWEIGWIEAPEGCSGISIIELMRSRP
ncbi:MAG: hypothetical protein ABIP54_03485 [Candidatus Andersenbacteria bacterium]